MPERILSEAIEHFDEGVDEIAALVKEVRGLKRWRLVSNAVIVILVAGGVVFGYVMHRLEQDRVEGCRGRNQSFSNVFDFIETQIGGDADSVRFVDGMRAASVMDCDRDGQTADDLVGRR